MSFCAIASWYSAPLSEQMSHWAAVRRVLQLDQRERGVGAYRRRLSLERLHKEPSTRNHKSLRSRPLTYFPHVADSIWHEFLLISASEQHLLRRQGAREPGAAAR